MKELAKFKLGNELAIGDRWRLVAAVAKINAELIIASFSSGCGPKDYARYLVGDLTARFNEEEIKDILLQCEFKEVLQAVWPEDIRYRQVRV